MKYILISVIILFFGTFGVFDPVRDVYQRASSPLQFGLSKGARIIKDTYDFFSNVKSVRDKSLHYEARILKLESDLAELEKIKQENIALKSQIESMDDLGINSKLVMAYTMGNNKDLTGSTLYINKGAKSGIIPGNNVVVDNIVVGIVKEVSTVKSLVQLITSSDSSATVLDLNSSQKTEGLAMGQLGTSIIVERILPNEEINVGDIIVTSGKDGIYIPGLYVGKVEEVVDDPSQPLKKAFIKTMVNYSKLDKVFVILEDLDE